MINFILFISVVVLLILTLICFLIKSYKKEKQKEKERIEERKRQKQELKRILEMARKDIEHAIETGTPYTGPNPLLLWLLSDMTDPPTLTLSQLLYTGDRK